MRADRWRTCPLLLRGGFWNRRPVSSTRSQRRLSEAPATPQRRPSDAPATPQRRPNDAPATPQRRLDDSPATPHDRFRSVTWSSPLFSKSSLSFALYHSLMTCIFDASSTDSKHQGAESNTVDSWRVPRIEIESKLKSTGPHRRSLANPRVRTCAPLRS